MSDEAVYSARRSNWCTIREGSGGTEAVEVSSGSSRRVRWVHGRCAELAVQCVCTGVGVVMRRCVIGAPLVHQSADVHSVPERANGRRAPI